MAAVEVFVEMGVECHHEGTLPVALELLAARLDLAGAGQLLTELCGYEWTPVKTDPHPKPVPKPPPPPKPPSPPAAGWRS